jgi:hypothetical protein
VLTFKDLKKRVSLELPRQQSKFFERLQNKPFWFWNVGEHRREDVNANGCCCFNHIIGLPQKDGTDKPLYDYEQIVFDSLVTQNSNKHLWIKKATGLTWHIRVYASIYGLALSQRQFTSRLTNVYCHRTKN